MRTTTPSSASEWEKLFKRTANELNIRRRAMSGDIAVLTEYMALRLTAAMSAALDELRAEFSNDAAEPTDDELAEVENENGVPSDADNSTADFLQSNEYREFLAKQRAAHGAHGQRHANPVHVPSTSKAVAKGGEA